MTEPIWLRRAWVDAFHFQQLKHFGGLYGLRDGAALDAALARPRNLWAYEDERDIVRLAAAYAYGLTRSHAYVDGNKRTAFISMVAFLDVNRRQFDAPEADAVQVMLGVAAGYIAEHAVADWGRGHTTSL